MNGPNSRPLSRRKPTEQHIWNSSKRRWRAEPDYFEPDAHQLLQLRFEKTVPAPEEPLHFAMQLEGLELNDASGTQVASYNVGLPSEEPYLLEGTFQPITRQEAPEGSFEKYWRWLGGPTEQTTIYLDPLPGEVVSGEIQGASPPFSNETIGVDVYFEGQRTDHLELEPEPSQTYSVSLIA